MSSLILSFRVVPRKVFFTRAVSSSSFPAMWNGDTRTQLKESVKAAMKARDTLSSTLLRSVLAEVYAADKIANDKVSDSAIVGILRKAISRRNESAIQYTKASRPELAAKEESEAKALAKFLPPQLTETEVTKHLNDAYEKVFTTPPEPSDIKKASGLVMKEFYSNVDKALVESEIVKRCLQEVLKTKAGTTTA